MPKYLMLDHGGVLDGIVTEEKPGNNDLLLAQIDDGLYQVLKNGVKIVKQLNFLVIECGYEIVFHSKNKEKDQLQLLEHLSKSCAEKYLEWPIVTAMAVRDQDIFPDIDSKEPIIIKDRTHGILIAGYGQDLDGKSCVRSALSKLLSINEESHSQHIIFDDGPSVVLAARAEGYRAYMIDKNLSLEEAISDVCQNVSKIGKDEIKESKFNTVEYFNSIYKSKEILFDENYNFQGQLFQFDSLNKNAKNVNEGEILQTNFEKDYLTSTKKIN